MVMAKIQIPGTQKQVFNGAATVEDTPMILLQVDMLQETFQNPEPLWHPMRFEA